MKLEHLQNNTYQVVDDKDNTVWFQGNKDECMEYMLKSFLDKLKNEPELLAVLKRLADK